MKMDEVSARSGKLLVPPFIVEEYWSGGGVEWCIKDSRGVWLIMNVGSKEDAEATCEAINSHDSQLLHIQLLLDRLEPFAKTYKGRTVIASGDDHRLAYKAVTELRELYPK